MLDSTKRLSKPIATNHPYSNVALTPEQFVKGAHDIKDILVVSKCVNITITCLVTKMTAT